MNFLVPANELPPEQPYDETPAASIVFGQRGIRVQVHLQPRDDPRFKPQKEVAAALGELLWALQSAGKTFIWDEQRIQRALTDVRKALASPN